VVFGAAGMLGTDVMRAAGPDAIGFARSEVDVTDAAAVGRAVADARAGVAINCAAYTDVDGAESEPEAAMAVNRDGARNVAAAAAAHGAAVVHVSTDYVFDGTKDGPYVPTDPTGPLQEYGRSKLEGERAVAAASPRHHIVRSSWLFGAAGPNFVETMLKLGRERDELRVVDDQVGCPTFTGHLAEALLELAASDDYGIHHRAGGGSCSWFEFARAIFERARVDCRVEPCTTDEFPRPARRPANSVLAGGDLPSWRGGLDAYLGARV
jgi:dTDP-4-dehydrorhamnose reductase